VLAGHVFFAKDEKEAYRDHPTYRAVEALLKCDARRVKLGQLKDVFQMFFPKVSGVFGEKLRHVQACKSSSPHDRHS
jgi:hypothetical protein